MKGKLSALLLMRVSYGRCRLQMAHVNEVHAGCAKIINASDSWHI